MTESILLTGGFGKFGKLISKKFIENGYQVVIITSNRSKHEEFISEICKPNLLFVIECNLMDSDAATKIDKHLKQNRLFVNHLINCARDMRYLNVDQDGLTRRSEFHSEFLLDVVVPYELSIQLATQANNQLKTVTNVSSIYGLGAFNKNLYPEYPFGAPIQYSVCKAATIQLSKELAVRFAPKIRVNTLAYGGVSGRVSSDFEDRYSKMVPIGRMLTDNEIFEPLRSVITPGYSGVTGHTLVVDGGWTIW